MGQMRPYCSFHSRIDNGAIDYMKLCASLWHFSSENGGISCDRLIWDFFNCLKSIAMFRMHWFGIPIAYNMYKGRCVKIFL